MLLLHHASLRLNFTTSPVEVFEKSLNLKAYFMVSYNRIAINFVSSHEEVLVCLDLFLCY